MKRNVLARDLRTAKYRPRVVKPKKGKGAYTRKNGRVDLAAAAASRGPTRGTDRDIVTVTVH